MSQFDRNYKPDPDTGNDPPWLIAIAGLLWAFLAIVMAFL